MEKTELQALIMARIRELIKILHRNSDDNKIWFLEATFEINQRILSEL